MERLRAFIKAPERMVPYKILLFFIPMLIIFFFLRIYQIELRNQFTWDQIDNAWAAKHIVIDHQLPLLGMQAKGKSGFFIGPLYYYFVAFFYWIGNLDPISSGFVAAVTGIIGVITIFLVSKKIFSTKVAVFVAIIQTFSSAAISFDRVQWPVQFVPILSLLAFYLLYKICTGNPKYIPFLALIAGLGFHIHFTLMVFIPIAVLLCLPFFPRKLQTMYYSFIGIGIFLLLLVPQIADALSTKNAHTNNMVSYLQTYYHGFHLRRMMQLVQDAFIQFEEIFGISFLKPLKFVLLPLLVLLTYFRFPRRKWFVLSYLCVLWFFIPWVIFSMYKGEISDYYFSFNRYLVVVIIGYLLGEVFSLITKYEVVNYAIKIAVIISVAYYAYVNYTSFIGNTNGDIAKHKEEVMAEVNKAGYITYSEGDIKSYLFYAYSWEKFKRKAYGK